MDQKRGNKNKNQRTQNEIKTGTKKMQVAKLDRKQESQNLNYL